VLNLPTGMICFVVQILHKEVCCSLLLGFITTN